MTDPHEHRTIVLDALPPALFDRAVTYLGDVLRECQLVLVGRSQGADTDPTLSNLAEGLVPDIEEMRDALEAADMRDNPDGTLRFETVLEVSQAGTLAHLQMQLVQLRLLGRGGGLLVESNPEVTELLAWIWDEAADQLHGRPPRPHRHGA